MSTINISNGINQLGVPGTVKGSIVKVAIAIGISVTILLVADKLLNYYYNLYPNLIKHSYTIYIHDAVAAIIAVSLAFATVRIIGGLISSYAEKTEGRRNLRGTFILIRIFIYALVLFWFLSYIGVDLTGALVGGAIGGIVIGLALQSIVSSMLSGIMVSGGGYIRPGDAISVYSWMFGQTITGRVEEVKLLHTRIRNSMGQTFLLPNNILFASTIFTPLGIGNKLSYTLAVNLPADAPAELLISKVGEELRGVTDKWKDFSFDIYLTTKNSGSNTYSVVMRFSEVDRLAMYQDAINKGFDRAYWNLKNSK